MKTLVVGFLFFLLSGCAVASLAGTAVSTAVKVVEVPLKVAGSILKDDEDDEKKESE
tara:strand:- start:387 stop:557 length:171 start_codon:yes stop_codon:yes gene_type:complete